MAKTHSPTDETLEQNTFPGILSDAWKPEVIHGPVTVMVHNQHRLLELRNIADLLEALSPDELHFFETDLQIMINNWCIRKGIPHP